MQDIKTLFKISQVLGKALKQVNEVCAHYLAQRSLDEQKPRSLASLNTHRVASSQNLHPDEHKKKSKAEKSEPKTTKSVNFADRAVSDSHEKKPEVKKQEKQEKEKKVVHPDRPKQPTTAFFLFQNDQKENFKKLNPEMSVTELSKSLGQVWNGLSAEQKKPFIDSYEEQKAKYEKKMAKFLKKHPEEKSKKQLKKQKNQQKQTHSEEKSEVIVEDSPPVKPAVQPTKPEGKKRTHVVVAEESDDSSSD